MAYSTVKDIIVYQNPCGANNCGNNQLHQAATNDIFTTQLNHALTPSVQHILRSAIATAAAHSSPLWVVGGVVRDVLLAQPLSHDLDVVVETHAPAVARALAMALDGKIVAIHEPFGTATIACGDTIIDVATARRERYSAPGALPLVEPSTMEEDLARRDFSINAMAMALAVQATTQQLLVTRFLDPFNGQNDLQQGVVRVLHDGSFDDDATRIIRGVRLCARLHMPFAPNTLALVQRALHNRRLAAPSPERIRTELCLALDEPAPDEVLRYADECGVAPHLFPALRWSEQFADGCHQLEHHLLQNTTITSQRSHTIAGMATYAWTADERDMFITRYRVPGDVARVMREVGTLRARVAASTHTSKQYTPRTLDNLFANYADATLMTLCCMEPHWCAAIMHYHAHVRHVTPLHNGHMLVTLGVPRGKLMGHLLRALRMARLDGVVVSLADEEAWVRNYLHNIQ